MNSPTTHTVFLALGTNLGEREENLAIARGALAAMLTIQKCSSIYETPPWGYADQPAFLNQVIQGFTQESPWELLAFLKQVEFEMGRTPTLLNGPRVIDLDILFYDDLVLESAILTIPHPRLEGRAFVLVPLAEIAPDLIHPVSNNSVREIVNELDTTGIHFYSNGCLENTPLNQTSPRDQSQRNMNMDILEQLRCYPEPVVRYLAETRLNDAPQVAASNPNFKEDVRHSPLITRLLSERNPDGKIPYHPYQKWRGAHWVLACLADLDYPAADHSLDPLFEQVYAWLFSDHHLRQIKQVNGRFRRCASQEGNALYASLVLDHIEDRTHALAERLLKVQWPDGGWNCDKRPEADHSSFFESLIPLRALARYAQLTQEPRFMLPVQAAGEFFLKHELYKREKDGQPIFPFFLNLHYPCYWHYDILFALKVMAEAGFISDPHCQAALDILEKKRSPEGGFIMNGRYFITSEKSKSNTSLVNWKSYTLPGKSHANAFITLDALYVLKKAGRNVQ